MVVADIRHTSDTLAGGISDSRAITERSAQAAHAPAGHKIEFRRAKAFSKGIQSRPALAALGTAEYLVAEHRPPRPSQTA
jgi:hypothetical protein